MKLLKYGGILVLLLLTVFNSFGQNPKEALYSKKGAINNGNVLETVPNESVQIQTKDGNIFIYQMGEVENVTVNPAKKYVNNLKNSYIGLSILPSFVVGTAPTYKYTVGNYVKSSVPKKGVLGMIDFGYLFNDYLGIAIVSHTGVLSYSQTITNTSTITTIKDYDVLPFHTFGAGPLYSKSLTSNIDWTIRPTFGYSVLVIRDYSISGLLNNSHHTNLDFSFQLGTSLRYHFHKDWSAALSLDYLYTTSYVNYEVDYHDSFRTVNSTTHPFNMLSIGFGIAYRLK